MRGNNVTTSILKTLTPLDGLKAENLQALVKKTTIQELSSGRFLFKEGDQEKRTIYVLKGEVELRTDTKVVRVVKAGADN